MNSEVEQFKSAMRAAGLHPPARIIPGELCRCPSSDRPRDDAGWFVYHDSVIPAGAFGCWRRGFDEKWRARSPNNDSERHQVQRSMERAQALRETEATRRHALAAQRAQGIWNKSKAVEDHPYLARKGVQAHGIRAYGDTLAIPVRDTEGKLRSLQFIQSDGQKKFLSGGAVRGHHFSIGTPDGVIVICEGYATGASVYEATGHAVAVAFDAGNLEAVARALRKNFPSTRIVVCGDNDESGVGQRTAEAAARAVDGLVALPETSGADWNDIHREGGVEAVKRGIEVASAPDVEARAPQDTGTANEWREPQPLTTKFEAVPYPLDALPETIRAAVEEVQAFTKAPVALVASSALGALSVAAQAVQDVQRAEKLKGPSSLFLLTIAESGERKTTCDGYFTSAIRDYEQQLAEAAKPEQTRYAAEIAAWEAERDGILAAIKRAGRRNEPVNGNSVDALRVALVELETAKPHALRVPSLIRGDDTPENLAWVLANKWPSAGVMSSEAGIVFGAHAMGKDSLMRNLALLNILWDGGTLKIGRRTSESFTVRGARLTVALQVQEATLRSFFDRADGLARGTGFLSRFLVAWPESTQGARPFTEAPKAWPALAAFHRRIRALLDTPAPIDAEGTLSPPIIPLAPDAKVAWIAFHDAIEAELGSGGELCDVRDVAAKAADNASRLAALFHVSEHGAGEAVGLKAFEGASRVVAWHLSEARRFFGELALPIELANAARLDSWLIEHCRRERTHIVSRRHIQRNVTPARLRQKVALSEALRELADAGHIRELSEGAHKDVLINPTLLTLGAA